MLDKVRCKCTKQDDGEFTSACCLDYGMDHAINNWTVYIRAGYTFLGSAHLACVLKYIAIWPSIAE